MIPFLSMYCINEMLRRCNYLAPFPISIGILPCPHLSRFREGKGKLSPTLDLTDPYAGQSVDRMGNIAALAAPSTKLSKVSIAPRIDSTFICQSQGLCISAAQCHLNHPLASQSLHLHHTYKTIIIPELY